MALIREIPRLPIAPMPLPRPSRPDCSSMFRQKNTVKLREETDHGVVHYADQWHWSNSSIPSRSQMLNFICIVSPPAATNPGALHHSASAVGSESSAGEQEGCRKLRNICRTSTLKRCSSSVSEAASVVGCGGT